LLEQALEDIAVYQGKSIIDAQTIAKLDSVQKVNSLAIVALRLSNELKDQSIRNIEDNLKACEKTRLSDTKKSTLIYGVLSFGFLTTTILYLTK